jgi:hypothetical protein
MRFLFGSCVAIASTVLLASTLKSQVPTVEDTTHEWRFPALVRAADSLAALDPGDAVTRALAAGDVRLLGIQGYGLIAPGVPTAYHLQYVREFGIRAMEHTSDLILGPDHKRYIEAAYRYAREYNRILLCRRGWHVE